ncbi:MAG TPA: hypothetical protein VI365_32735 [Trebonia sp.]
MAGRWAKVLGVLVAGGVLVIGVAILFGQGTVAFTIPVASILGGRLAVRAMTGGSPGRRADDS